MDEDIVIRMREGHPGRAQGGRNWRVADVENFSRNVAGIRMR